MSKEIITTEDGENFVKRSYKIFASYANRTRTLPLYLDGLKAVNRRLLYSMYELGAVSPKFLKSLTITGHCQGHYHGHGDSIIETLYTLANASPYVETQGNFGFESVNTIEAASGRYTECSLTKEGKRFLFEFLKEIPFEEADILGEEPRFLPVYIPHCYVSKTYGIGTGVTTNIPTYRLKDLCTLAMCVIRKEKVPAMLYPHVEGNILLQEQSELDKLYKSGSGKVKFMLDYKVFEDKLVILGKPELSSKTSLKTIISNLCDKYNFDYNDISNDKIEVELKVKPYTRGFTSYKEISSEKFFRDAITYAVSYKSLFTDTNGKATTYDVIYLVTMCVHNIIKLYCNRLDSQMVQLEFEKAKLATLKECVKSDLFSTFKAREVLEKKISETCKKVIKKSLDGQEDSITKAILQMPISSISRDLDNKIRDNKEDIENLQNDMKPENVMRKIESDYRELSKS